MKILIVEDEPSLRELIQCSLEKERYVVETASDFNSALRKVEDYDYDCILLDIMLPDGSGFPQRTPWKTKFWDWNWERMIIYRSHFIWLN